MGGDLQLTGTAENEVAGENVSGGVIRSKLDRLRL